MKLDRTGYVENPVTTFILSLQHLPEWAKSPPSVNSGFVTRSVVLKDYSLCREQEEDRLFDAMIEAKGLFCTFTFLFLLGVCLEIVSWYHRATRNDLSAYRTKWRIFLSPLLSKTENIKPDTVETTRDIFGDYAIIWIVVLFKSFTPNDIK